MDIKSFVLVQHGDSYLLVKEASFKWKGRWFLPGGSVRKGEKPEDGARREALEESGCEVDPDGLFYVKCYQGMLRGKLYLFYTARLTGGELKTTRNKHSLEAAWFTYEEMKKLPLRQKLLKIIDRHRKNGRSMPVKNLKVVMMKSALQKLMG
jgi:8-oxo-dGTP diphosphatase